MIALAVSLVTTVIGAVSGKTLDEVTLVGDKGEIYQRKDGAWRRETLGGTAATLVAATGTARDLWAIGPTTPAYHWTGATWSALPVPEDEPGNAVLARGGAAFGEGHLVWVLAGHAFASLPELSATPLAVWSEGKDVVVALTSGHLARSSGGSWTRLKPALQPDEKIVALLPVTGGALAVGDAGTLLVVDGAQTRAVAVDPALGAFVPRVSSEGRRSLLLAEGGALAELAGDRLKLIETIPIPDGETPVALAQAADGALVVVLTHGALVRSASGWQLEAIDDAPPVEPPHATDPPLQLTP